MLQVHGPPEQQVYTLTFLFLESAAHHHCKSFAPPEAFLSDISELAGLCHSTLNSNVVVSGMTSF